VVECQLPKLDVAGSSPVSRSRNKGLISSRRYDDFAQNLKRGSRWGGVGSWKHFPGKSKPSCLGRGKPQTSKLPKSCILLDKTLLQFLHSRLLHIKRRLRVLVLSHVDAMPHNVRAAFSRRRLLPFVEWRMCAAWLDS
jgi:hypothetical protein